MTSSIVSILTLLLFLSVDSTLVINANHGVEAYASRTYFYAGGRYVNVTQIYVEKLEPLQKTKEWPIVMIEGAGQTATVSMSLVPPSPNLNCTEPVTTTQSNSDALIVSRLGRLTIQNFLNTPDGRSGWATYFLNEGYRVYLVDQVARGRSPWIPLGFAQDFTISTAETVESYWSAPQLFNLWPQARNYSQWPGTTGLRGDPVFDAFFASQVQFITNWTQAGLVMQSAGLDLLRKVGPAILLTHSQSGGHGWLIADVAQPLGLIKGIVAIEPEGPPFIDRIPYFGSDNSRPYGLTSLPLTYSPPVASGSELKTIIVQPPLGSNGTLFNCTQQDPAQTGGPRQLLNLQGFPVLMVTGSASFHATYDYCMVEYLQNAGVDTTWLDLGKEGIEGNGHFLFLEKNNHLIAEKIEAWLAANIH